MSKKPSKKTSIILLIVALVAVAAGGVTFVGATAGWFNSVEETTLDAEYTTKSERIVIDNDTFNSLISSKKSFIMTSYLPTCTAKIIDYMKQFADKYNITYYFYQWSALRETFVHNYVNFPPTVIVFSEGKIIKYLRSDSDEDIEPYNNYDAFENWLKKYIKNI